VLREAGLDLGEEDGVETAVDYLFEVEGDRSGGCECGFVDSVQDQSEDLWS
jgi:hypothetical protein